MSKAKIAVAGIGYVGLSHAAPAGADFVPVGYTAAQGRRPVEARGQSP